MGIGGFLETLIMSMTGISGAPPVNQPPQQDSGFRSAFQQLTSAIGSGDLDAAQKAYAALQGQAPPKGPVADALSSIGDALGKGDISSAQSTLAAMRQHHGHHHHKPAAATDGSDSDSTPPRPTTDGTGAAVDVTA